MKQTIALFILLALAGCKTAERYEYKINLPRSVFTDSVDPNDMAYRGMVHMSPAWRKTYGPSHWSLSLYNWAVMRDRVENMEQAVQGGDKEVEKLKKSLGKIEERLKTIETDLY